MRVSAQIWLEVLAKVGGTTRVSTCAQAACEPKPVAPRIWAATSRWNSEMLRSPKHRSLVGQLPRDRLLTETDVRLLPYARTSKASDWTVDIALPERRIKTGCCRSGWRLPFSAGCRYPTLGRARRAIAIGPKAAVTQKPGARSRSQERRVASEYEQFCQRKPLRRLKRRHRAHEPHQQGRVGSGVAGSHKDGERSKWYLGIEVDDALEISEQTEI